MAFRGGPPVVAAAAPSATAWTASRSAPPPTAAAPQEYYYDDDEYGMDDGGMASGAAMAAAAKSKPVDPRSRLTRIVLSGSAALKIIRHGTRTFPELCAGVLLGADDGEGGLEVTDTVAFPPAMGVARGGDDGAMDDGNNRGGGSVQDVAGFTNDAMRLLKDVNADDNCVGWYRSVNMGDWCTGDLIEEQFEHQEELDLGTGLAKCALIVYDPYQSENGNISLKALRLTDAFMDIMRSRQGSDIKAVAASYAAIAHVRMTDVFVEIPVEIWNPPLINRFLGSLAATAPTFTDDLDTDFDRLAIATDPYLEKNVAFISEAMDKLQGANAAAAQYQRQLALQKDKQAKFIAERKAENVKRAERGLEPLPLRDPDHHAFRPVRDSSRLDALSVRKQIDVYCEQMNAWAAQSIEKLYLVSATVQTKQAWSSSSGAAAAGAPSQAQ